MSCVMLQPQATGTCPLGLRGMKDSMRTDQGGRGAGGGAESVRRTLPSNSNPQSDEHNVMDLVCEQGRWCLNGACIGAFHLVHMHLGGGGGALSLLHFFIIIAYYIQKWGGGVQIACKVACVLNAMPPTLTSRRYFAYLADIVIREIGYGRKKVM